MDPSHGLKLEHLTAPALENSPGIAERIGSAIASLVDHVLAALVAAEIMVLFSAVVARYVLNSPLLWSDEIAETLFVWLSLLGAVAAFHRGQHMRMAAFSSSGSAHRKKILDQLPTFAAFVFAASLFYVGCESVYEESFITTPALNLSGAWHAAAVPVGLGLIVVLACLQFIKSRDKDLIGIALAVLLAIAVLQLAKPFLISLGNFNLIIFFVLGIGGLVFLGVPIAFAFGLATIAYVAFSTNTPLIAIVGMMNEGMSHVILLSIPMFVFLGLLLTATGMAAAMVGFLANLLGHVRGGLQYVLVAAMYLVSGISGSKAADMAAVAPALFPEMIRRGSKPGDLLALLAATGAQTETVPPSIVLIALGAVTGLSISALFLAGLLPSLVLGIALCVLIWWMSRKEAAFATERASSAQILKTAVVAAPALILPFVIRGAVIEGIATATEVSTIGIAYCLVLGSLFYRELQWSRLWSMLVETAVLSGAIMLILGTATAMGWALTQSGFSRELGALFKALPGGPVVFMMVSILAFIILGSVLEGMPAIVLFGPLLFPIASQLGIDGIHYAMVVVLAMGIGLFAPPFGVGYYTACAIARVDPALGLRPILRYLVVLVIGLVVVAAVPWLSTVRL